MGLVTDLRTLYALALAPVRGESHADRLESFYRRQAGHYDSFRERLLQGRRELMHAIPLPAGGTWIDIGGGTGRNLEFLGNDLHTLDRVLLVDLCPPLLDVARWRIARRRWRNVSLLRADAARPWLAPGKADVVTFSYSLTMIPDWFEAIERARDALRPGGMIGVVDFYVARRHPGAGARPHGWATRHGWPAWFDRDGVRPSPDHLPYLQSRFETTVCLESRAPVPYLPGVRVPYYVFTGRRPA
jgi:S-adenosylmethionine-diacylgycerolhomoserine-N-methlytransferase